MPLLLGFDIFSIILIVVFFVVSWKFFQKDEKTAIFNKLPGPASFPLIGTVVQLYEAKEKIVENVVERRKKFGSIYRLWLGSHPVVVLSGAEEIEVVLKSSKFSQKSFGYKFLYPWLGTGLLTSYGDKWRARRKLITPTFHFKILENFCKVYQENVTILVNKLQGMADTGKEFDINPLVTLCTLDIICETAMGTKINAQTENESKYVKSVNSLTFLTIHRISRPWLHPDFLFRLSSSGREYQKHLDVVQNFTKNVIQARKEALKNEKSEESTNKITFLDLLLKASANEFQPLTDEELRQEVDTFMFAGHDTTATSVIWTLFLLGHHPKIQEEVYAEVKNVIDSKQKDLITLADLADMKLLERVIKESMRLCPSVFSIGRILEEDVKFGEYSIPKGTNAFLNIYVLHRDPKHFKDPEIFDPDRFLPENCLKRHPYAYIPFSAGPRNCIGQKFAMIEEKVLLSNLIYAYKFESMEKLEDVKKIPALTMRPKFGIKVKIYKR